MLVKISFSRHKKIEQRRRQHSAPATGHKSSVNFTITTFSFYIFGCYDKSILAYFRMKCAIFYEFNCGFSRYRVLLHCGVEFYGKLVIIYMHGLVVHGSLVYIAGSRRGAAGRGATRDECITTLYNVSRFPHSLILIPVQPAP